MHLLHKRPFGDLVGFEVGHFIRFAETTLRLHFFFHVGPVVTRLPSLVDGRLGPANFRFVLESSRWRLASNVALEVVK